MWITLSSVNNNKKDEKEEEEVERGKGMKNSDTCYNNKKTTSLKELKSTVWFDGCKKE